MIIARAEVITLCPDELTVLSARANGSQVAHRDVLRARIVLAAGQGLANAVIAATMGPHVDTVRKWRRRFAGGGLAGLGDLPRRGRPSRFTPVQVVEVKALACELPAEPSGQGPARPLSRWSVAELTAAVIERQVVSAISASTVRRWLRADAIKPWQHRSWIFPRDPQFAAKAARVLDLQGPFKVDCPVIFAVEGSGR